MNQEQEQSRAQEDAVKEVEGGVTAGPRESRSPPRCVTHDIAIELVANLRCQLVVLHGGEQQR